MRILWVEIGGAPVIGGHTARSFHVCSELLAQGVELQLVLLDRGIDDAQLWNHAIDPARVVRIACLNHRFNVARPDWQKVSGLVEQTDLVVLTSFLWGAAPWIWWCAHLQGKPWVINPAGVLPYFHRSIWIKQVCHWLYGARMLRDAAALIAITQTERDALIPFASDPKRVAIIPNGVEMETALAVRAIPAAVAPSDAAVSMLFLGRLEEVKGLDQFLHALARLAPTVASRILLTIAGDGSQRDALQQLVQELALPTRVCFVGFVDADTKARLLAETDWVVIPSRRDAMTLVALEAAASGKPVLLTRQCGFPELAECGGGIEVDASVDALAEGIERILRCPDDWEPMGRRLHRLACERYSWRTIAEQHVALFKQILA